MPEIQWNQLMRPDLLDRAVSGYEAGQKNALASGRREALAQYATDPGRSLNSLISMGDLAGAAQLSSLDTVRRRQGARTAAEPFLARGDLTGAARAAIEDTDYAGSLLELAKAGTAEEKAVAERTNGVIAGYFPSFSKLEPSQRKALYDQNIVPDLKRAGAPDAGIAALDPDQPNAMAVWDARYRLALGAEGSARRDDEAADRNAPKVVGQTLVTPTGEVLYRAPRYETLGPGQELVELDGEGGGGASPPSNLWSRVEQRESGGDQGAVSPKGAFGVAQLMPDTAAGMSRDLGSPQLAGEARRSPETNRSLGQLYLSQQQQRYGSDALALAAYNAGPGRVDEWLQQYGDPRSGRISEAEWVAKIPFAETRNYVQSIMGGQAGVSKPRAAAGQQGSRVVARGAPKQGYRPATADDLAGYPGLDPTASYQVSPEGRISQVNTGGMTPRQMAQSSMQLRKEFDGLPDVKAYNEVATAYDQVRQLAKPNATPADDLALGFSFMRLLDPTSVVREGEFAQVGKTGGLSDQLVMALQRIDQGKGLTPAMRERLVAAAGTVFRSRQGRYDQLVGQYQGYARQSGLPEGTIEARKVEQSRPQQYTDAQRQYEQRAGRQNGPAGARTRPYYLKATNPDASYRNIPKGAYYVGPDGQLRKK